MALDLQSDDSGQLRSRRLVRAGLSGLAARMLIVVVGLAATPIIVRSLGAGEYGVYATITMTSAMFAFADLGIGNGLVTRLAALDGANDRDGQRRLVSNAGALLLLSGVGVLAFGLTAAVFIPWRRVLNADSVPNGELETSVLVFVVVLGLSVPASLGQKVLIGLQRGGTANVWLLATMTASLGLTALAAATDARFPVVVAATVVPAAAIGVVQSFWLLKATFLYLRPRIADVTSADMVSLLRVGQLFLLLSVASAVAFQTDLLVVSAVVGAEAAGVFAVCLRLFQIVTVANSALFGQLWPSFAEALERGDVRWVREALNRSIVGIALVVTPTMVVIVLLGQDLVRWWAGDTVVPARGLLIAMAAWTLQQCLIFPVAMLMNGGGVVRFQAVAASAMAVANIITSVLLAHTLGAAGPVWASLLTHTLINAVPAVLIVRHRFLSMDSSVAAARARMA